MEKIKASLFLVPLLWFSFFSLLPIETTSAENEGYTETYHFSFQLIDYGPSGYMLQGLVGSGGYINVLIPPDASVISTELIGTSGSVELTNFTYQGVFNMRCYKFAQILIEYENGDQNSIIIPRHGPS